VDLGCTSGRLHGAHRGDAALEVIDCGPPGRRTGPFPKPSHAPRPLYRRIRDYADRRRPKCSPTIPSKSSTWRSESSTEIRMRMVKHWVDGSQLLCCAFFGA
jgi:hypothetical protein